jgi:hypothetical protein
MYYVRHHIKGGLVRHHNENRLGVHKAEANFPIKRKWSLSKKCDVCVSRETRGSVRHLSEGVTRVGMYVTSFFKTQPQFSGDTEILN